MLATWRLGSMVMVVKPPPLLLKIAVSWPLPVSAPGVPAVVPAGVGRVLEFVRVAQSPPEPVPSHEPLAAKPVFDIAMHKSKTAPRRTGPECRCAAFLKTSTLLDNKATIDNGPGLANFFIGIGTSLLRDSLGNCSYSRTDY